MLPTNPLLWFGLAVCLVLKGAMILRSVSRSTTYDLTPRSGYYIRIRLTAARLRRRLHVSCKSCKSLACKRSEDETRSWEAPVACLR